MMALARKHKYRTCIWSQNDITFWAIPPRKLPACRKKTDGWGDDFRFGMVSCQCISHEAFCRWSLIQKHFFQRQWNHCSNSQIQQTGGFRSISLSSNSRLPNKGKSEGNYRKPSENHGKMIRDPSRIGAECFTTQSLMTWETKTTMITMGPMWSSFMYIKIFKTLAMKIPGVLQYSISFYQSLYKQALDKNHPCMQGMTKNLQDIHPPKNNMTMEDHHL